jgi:hypothetical protein
MGTVRAMGLEPGTVTGPELGMELELGMGMVQERELGPHKRRPERR